MQTFLTSTLSFKETAQSLDTKRLGKQRVEVLQILNANNSYNKSNGDAFLLKDIAWRNHPAVRMWRGYEGLLCVYGCMMCKEFLNRGYKDSLLSTFQDGVCKYPLIVPYWWSSSEYKERIVLSHRANLYKKDPAFYKEWKDIPYTPYVWPPSSSPTLDPILLTL